MLSIQDVGLSIMGDTPKSLYFLGGPEYGVKFKYINILASKLGSIQEFSGMMSFISFMSKIHIIPMQSHVYVIRYDKEFISKLNADLADTLTHLDILGTVVVLYDDEASIRKLNKFFPDNVAVINYVDSKYLIKYLKADFPDLNPKIFKFIAANIQDYYQARLVAGCLNCVRNTPAGNMTESEISSLFGLVPTVSNSDIQIAVASRNYVDYLNLLDNYDRDYNSIIYIILNTMSELDKVLDNKFANSPVKKFGDKWTRADVYCMFNQTYYVLDVLRNGFHVDIKDMLIYLGALLRFQQIPDVGVLA